jgi:hypothetical protein
MKTRLALLSFAFVTMAIRTASAATFARETQKPAPSPVGRPGRPHARHALRAFLKKLDATETQRKLALEEARAAQPIARDARIEASRIRIEALREHPGDRAAARAAARPKLKDLRQRTLESLRPHAQKLLASLSADQRKTIEDSARARGKQPDEERLEKVVSWLLTRPGAEARIRKATTR